MVGGEGVAGGADGRTKKKVEGEVGAEGLFCFFEEFLGEVLVESFSAGMKGTNCKNFSIFFDGGKSGDAVGGSNDKKQAFF